MLESVMAMSDCNRFRTYFGDTNRVRWHLVSVSDFAQARQAVEDIRAAGSDGVFLVTGGISEQKLLEFAADIARNAKGFFVGLRCDKLLTQRQPVAIPAEIAGLWTAEANDEAALSAIARSRSLHGWNGLHVAASPRWGDAGESGDADVFLWPRPDERTSPPAAFWRIAWRVVGGRPVAVRVAAKSDAGFLLVSRPGDGGAGQQGS